MFFSTNQRVTPLSAAVSLQQLFRLYLAFIEISCVWINVVDIKLNLCLYNKFYSNSNRFITKKLPPWGNMEQKIWKDIGHITVLKICSYCKI